MIARHVPGQKSLLGTALDPFADKLLIITMTISLTLADAIPCSFQEFSKMYAQFNAIVVALAGLILLRDVTMIGAGFYIRYKSLRPAVKSVKNSSSIGFL